MYPSRILKHIYLEMLLIHQILEYRQSDIIMRLVFDRLSDEDVVKLVHHLIETNQLGLLERLTTSFDPIYWKARMQIYIFFNSVIQSTPKNGLASLILYQISGKLYLTYW